jgi:hypothetical protein
LHSSAPELAGRDSGAILDRATLLERDLMMRQSIRMFGFLACAMAAGCGVSASGLGLSSEFTAAARDAHRYIESHVIPEIRNSRFPTVLTESRGKVKSLQAKATNDAERGVWLLLTMINAKANESRGAYELSLRPNWSSPSLTAASQEVQAERQQCMNEVGDWLAGNASQLAALRAAPCLQQAKQAAAILGR